MDLQLSKERAVGEAISPGAAASIAYHDIFDYPLSFSELIKWESGKAFKKDVAVGSKNGFFFVAGKEGGILKRLMRKRISARKSEIAKRAGELLRILPTVKLVGITGALAMENADEASDVDLLIITGKGTLWSSRLLVLLLLAAVGFPTRRFGQKEQKDKLCLNMWLDENALAWPKRDRNIYTAHEIAQIIPLVNKEKAYERFVSANRWIKDYWPNALKIQATKFKMKTPSRLITFIVEPLARRLQGWYMKNKITREVVGPKRAIFHPHDWGGLVKARLAGWGFED